MGVIILIADVALCVSSQNVSGLGVGGLQWPGGPLRWVADEQTVVVLLVSLDLPAFVVDGGRVGLLERVLSTTTVGVIGRDVVRAGASPRLSVSGLMGKCPSVLVRAQVSVIL
eukprot:g4160.t1